MHLVSVYKICVFTNRKHADFVNKRDKKVDFAFSDACKILPHSSEKVRCFAQNLTSPEAISASPAGYTQENEPLSLRLPGQIKTAAHL